MAFNVRTGTGSWASTAYGGSKATRAATRRATNIQSGRMVGSSGGANVINPAMPAAIAGRTLGATQGGGAGILAAAGTGLAIAEATGLIDVLPGEGIPGVTIGAGGLSSLIPGGEPAIISELPSGRPTVKTWWTGTAQGAMDDEGNMYMLRKDGVWKKIPKRKGYPIGKNPTAANIRRLAAAIKHHKGTYSKLSKIYKKATRKKPAARAAIMPRGDESKVVIT